LIPARIEFIHRVIEAVAEPVGSDACLGDLEPVGLEEEAQFGVVVPRVEVLEPCIGVLAFADPAFGLGGGVAGEEPFRLLAEGFVEGALDLHARRIGDCADRTQPVAVQVGGDGGGGAVQEFDGRVGAA
jgi:hypothetical protein